MDLWASPTLRSGGEDIAHALALMGVEPLWDNASTGASPASPSCRSRSSPSRALT